MKNAELKTDKLVADLKRVVRHSEELLQNTADTVGDKVHEVRERLNDALEGARDTCRKLEDKTLEGAKAADKTIREHPYQSIGPRLRAWTAYRRAGNAEINRARRLPNWWHSFRIRHREPDRRTELGCLERQYDVDESLSLRCIRVQTELTGHGTERRRTLSVVQSGLLGAFRTVSLRSSRCNRRLVLIQFMKARFLIVALVMVCFGCRTPQPLHGDLTQSVTAAVLARHHFTPPVWIYGMRGVVYAVASRPHSESAVDIVKVEIPRTAKATVAMDAYQYGPSDWAMLGPLFIGDRLQRESSAMQSEIRKHLVPESSTAPVPGATDVP